MSPRDRLECYAEFLGMNTPACFTVKFAFRSAIPLPYCSLRVCLSTDFAAVSQFFHQQKSLDFLAKEIPTFSAHLFCSRDDIYTLQWNCSSTSNFCKCTKSSSTVLTNRYIKWNLHSSTSIYLSTFSRLLLSFGGFSKHQNNTSDTGSNKKSCHISCVASQCQY